MCRGRREKSQDRCGVADIGRGRISRDKHQTPGKVVDGPIEKAFCGLAEKFGECIQRRTTTQVIQMWRERDTGHRQKLRRAVVAHREGMTSNQTPQRLTRKCAFPRGQKKKG